MYGIFSKYEQHMTLKIKNKQIILTKLYFRQSYIMRKLKLQGSFRGSGSGIFPDPGDQNKPESGYATLL